MSSNKVILRQMIRLSRIIKELKEARAKLASVNAQSTYFIVEGENSSILKTQTKNSIANCLFTEKYLHSSVSNACRCLDGFNAKTMDPVDYISSSDIHNRFIDICKGKSVVATIDLSTGNITRLEPEHVNTAEEKCTVENS